jgi:sugar lactone lactonase YvrE
VTRLAVALVAALALLPATAEAVPDCAPGQPRPQTVFDGTDSLEALIVDARGRIFYSDTPQMAVMRIDSPGAKPVRLATGIESPGGMVFDDQGQLLVGYGDSIATALGGQVGPGQAGIWRVDPETGAKTIHARGTTMSNGLARTRDGTVFASADAGTQIDRIGPGGSPLQKGWANIATPNGMAVDATDRYLYVNQTFQPAAIARIEIANPANVTTFMSALGGTDIAAGLDGMTIDSAGRLYSAANEIGEVWRISTAGTPCALARGISNPSAVALGSGSIDGQLIVVGFGGKVQSIALPGTRAAPNTTGGDTVAPRLLLQVRRRVHGRYVRVRVSCNEICSLTLRLGRHSLRRSLAAGTPVRLRIRAPGARRATLRAVAVDRSGNRASVRRVLLIRR